MLHNENLNIQEAELPEAPPAPAVEPPAPTPAEAPPAEAQAPAQTPAAPPPARRPSSAAQPEGAAVAPGVVLRESALSFGALWAKQYFARARENALIEGAVVRVEGNSVVAAWKFPDQDEPGEFPMKLARAALLARLAADARRCAAAPEAQGRGALDVREQFVLFDGNAPHSTIPFAGARLHAIFFTHASQYALPEGERAYCDALGFPMPHPKLCKPPHMRTAEERLMAGRDACRARPSSAAELARGHRRGAPLVDHRVIVGLEWCKFARRWTAVTELRDKHLDPANFPKPSPPFSENTIEKYPLDKALVDYILKSPHNPDIKPPKKPPHKPAAQKPAPGPAAKPGSRASRARRRRAPARARGADRPDLPLTVARARRAARCASTAPKSGQWRGHEVTVPAADLVRFGAGLGPRRRPAAAAPRPRRRARDQRSAARGAPRRGAPAARGAAREPAARRAAARRGAHADEARRRRRRPGGGGRARDARRRRRRPTSGELGDGWWEKRDPATGRCYYVHEITAACQWERPDIPSDESDDDEVEVALPDERPRWRSDADGAA
ncbi:hypothetical protein SO694_00134083 [Aureococcus anophagefferens]|uniref:WW domain-containing protein n=1 Tax=Aureococcus anophagefferens TaxID=44056 RepID=A0ABR1GFL2_AURAN